MPVMGNLGNISYVLTALLGGLVAINGIGGLTLGGLASFLQLNRSFTMPITQISQQLNSVIMASAGASRIFALMDEGLELDDGLVTLANVQEVDGELIESEVPTGKWAWRHPRRDGAVQYVPLVGNIIFDDVNFGYHENKQILYNIKLYAERGQKVAFVGATAVSYTHLSGLQIIRRHWKRYRQLISMLFCSMGMKLQEQHCHVLGISPKCVHFH